MAKLIASARAAGWQLRDLEATAASERRIAAARAAFEKACRAVGSARPAYQRARDPFGLGGSHPDVHFPTLQPACTALVPQQVGFAIFEQLGDVAAHRVGGGATKRAYGTAEAALGGAGNHHRISFGFANRLYVENKRSFTLTSRANLTNGWLEILVDPIGRGEITVSHHLVVRVGGMTRQRSARLKRLSLDEASIEFDTEFGITNQLTIVECLPPLGLRGYTGYFVVEEAIIIDMVRSSRQFVRTFGEAMVVFDSAMGTACRDC